MTAIKRIHHVFGRMGLIWFNYLYPKKLPHWKTNVQTKNHHAKVQALQGPSHLKIALLQHPPQPILRWATAIQAPLPWASVPPVRQFPPQPAVQRWKPPGRVVSAGGENGRWVLKGIPWLGRRWEIKQVEEIPSLGSWLTLSDDGSPCQMSGDWIFRASLKKPLTSLMFKIGLRYLPNRKHLIVCIPKKFLAIELLKPAFFERGGLITSHHAPPYIIQEIYIYTVYILHYFPINKSDNQTQINSKIQ